MFWKELLKALQYMKVRKSQMDPCLYYKWIDGQGLCLWLLSWIDKDIGELKEYVGCKIGIDRKDRSLKITEPVVLQSSEDEFKLPGAKYSTPTEAGQALEEAEERNYLPPEDHFIIQSGARKLLHMMRWSRPEAWNATRDLSRRMGKAKGAHMKAMLKQMKFCVDTPKRGWKLKHQRAWDGKSDSDYANCKQTRGSVSGFSGFLEGAPVSLKS
jgi:hypothetical protein